MGTGAGDSDTLRCLSQEVELGVFLLFLQLMRFPGLVSPEGSLGIQFIWSNPSAVSHSLCPGRAGHGRGQPCCFPPLCFFQRFPKFDAFPAEFPN